MPESFCSGGLGTSTLLPQKYSSLLFLDLWRFKNLYPDPFISSLIFLPSPPLTSYVTFETLETGKLTMDPPSTLTLTTWVPYLEHITIMFPTIFLQTLTSVILLVDSTVPYLMVPLTSQ